MNPRVCPKARPTARKSGRMEIEALCAALQAPCAERIPPEALVEK